MLYQLENLIPNAPHWSGIGLLRHDWRPIWALTKEIQEAFNAGPNFSLKEERQVAWNRFNSLRDRASRNVNAERKALHDRSEKHRAAIFDMCKGIEYSAVSDIIFFFDQTTVTQVKRWGQYLGAAMRALSERKQEMIPEHKQVCFERIQQVKDSHDCFWGEYKKAGAARREKHLEHRAEFVENAKKNRENNLERLSKAENALIRQRDRIAELREKVDQSTSAKWRDIHETWLIEAEVKANDISSSVDRIKEWIEEDERRLRELDQ